MPNIFSQLMTVSEQRGGGFFLLIDPDRLSQSQYCALAAASEECGVDAILVGTSFMLNGDFATAVKDIKVETDLPVIIFPGSYAQITKHADAILFTSLISGRNPTYLIDEQVKGAPAVKKFGLEPIPTGYMLIESGPLTSVQFISGSCPIPRAKNDLACAHALAAQYLGMKLVYLEAGSGAVEAVPVEMVKEVSSYVDIPVMVGGGLQTPDDCAVRIENGARFIIMGNRIERDPHFTFLREVTSATHTKSAIGV